MGLFEIIMLSVWGTFLLIWICCEICSGIHSHSQHKKLRQEWYMETLKKLIERVDELECDIDVITEDIETIANDIYMEEK